MGWYTVSGRQVGWAVGLLSSQPSEHFVYPNYPANISWFSVVPLLQNIRFQFPAGINALALLGYRHLAGATAALIPSVAFSLDLYVQQGAPLRFIDALISNSVWEVWDDAAGVPVARLPLPFTFVFSLFQPEGTVIRQVLCPYAYVSRLRGYIEGESRALRLLADFVTPTFQLISEGFLAVVSSYDPDMPPPIVREITTDDWGTRQLVDLSWELTNQIEFVHSSWRSDQPVDFIRTANRLVYRGSQIQVNLQVLHPYFVGNRFSEDLSLPPFDFQFILDHRYDNPAFEKRRLKFYDGRITSVEIGYSFDAPAIEQVQILARYLKWEEAN